MTYLCGRREWACGSGGACGGRRGDLYSGGRACDSRDPYQ